MKEDFYKKLLLEHTLCPDCPSPVEVVRFFKKLCGLFFQDFAVKKFKTIEEIQNYESDLRTELSKLLVRNPDNDASHVPDIVSEFFNLIPIIHGKLAMDIDAMFMGDPAAKSRREIIRSYPGFYATFVHRIANGMLYSGIKDMPRIISEYAHSKTGIDIHPGAQIGSHFCIDHGTGIVIGETSIIGNHVKIYQGVTLGALSVNKEDASTKRHPTIEDNVVIYASATILGGNTIIGQNSVIGGNVWITRSVPANTKVYYKAAMANDDAPQVDTFVFKEY
ncbi:MAG: serine acetyltransferase [Saprospiraceae bacterium]|nr:serine acetyltransferase [Saprospiraceae bacterium]MBK8634632.1 serine acetyltransferase [Saprospiraceae bacterium]MBP7642625.1 serine acetyltransferase [Saprospiraceae bacterium]